MEKIEHNEMFNSHSSMAYLQGGMPLDLVLEGKDDLNHCEGELPCDQKNYVPLTMGLQYTYDEPCLSLGPNNSCILLLPSLH